MKLSLTVLFCAIVVFVARNKAFAQASFTAPDNVYVNTPLTVTNTSTGASSWYWNFCSGGVYNAPQITNLGNITGMDAPVFIATAKEGNDYYAFFTNNGLTNPNLYKLYFGNSLLNTPVVTDLGNFGGVIPGGTEGVQVVQDSDGWHVLVVGGPLPDSRIVKVDFGASLANPAPVAVNWGNLGNLDYPHDLYITKENNNWYGLTVNAYNNTVTRFDFGTSFQNPPVATNLGNLGNLSYPDGIFPVLENGNWHAFVTNMTSNTISRLDFGSSLSNTPTGTNLGNPGGLDQPRDLTVLQDCGRLSGLVVNAGTDDIVRLDFNSGIAGPVSGVSLGVGAAGGLDFPHSISTMFREGNTLYAFIVNAHNNTLARIAYNSCTNASIPSSNLQHPPAVSFNAPGAYTINLVTNEGLANQSTFCKTINVLAPPSPVSVAGFTAPDTVCVNAPVNITNTSTGAGTYFWNFCSGGIFNTPQLDNLGNPGGTMSMPVFMATAKDGNDYYGFFTNHTQSLVKLYFGNSLLNTPVATDMGNFGGELPLQTEGLQIVQDAGGWHILVCGGYDPGLARLVKLDFGASLSNPSPVLTNWGNIGNMNFPTDLYVTKQNNNWYGFTVSYYNSTVTRFDFGTSFNNTPVAMNLGNIGILDHPTGISAQEQNGNWFVFITNETSNTLTRMDFGASLANTPTAVNLGNPGGVLNGPRDLSILQDCGNVFAVVMNHFDNSISRIDFRNGMTSQLPGGLSGMTLATPAGGLNFPHSISTLFREGNSLYAFITNADNNTLSRLMFASCNDASIPSSTLQQPPVISYSNPGTYTINLVADESLSSQSAFCKNIVVIDPPEVNLGADTVLCSGTTLTLDAGAGFNSYQWSNGATTQQITVSQSGTYSVQVSKGGCAASDEIAVTINQLLQLTPVVTDINCIQPTGSITLNVSGGAAPYRYYLDTNGPASNNIFSNLSAGTYTVRVDDRNGCTISAPVTVVTNPDGIIDMTATGTNPSCNGLSDGTISALVLQGLAPFEYAVNNLPFQSSSSFSNLPAGEYMVYARNSMCIDSQQVTLTAPATVTVQITAADELCSRGNGSIVLVMSGGTQPYNIYWNDVLTNAVSRNNLAAGSYALRVDDARGCSADTLVTINNVITPRVQILNNDTTINIGESIRLVAVNAPDYVWTPATGLSCNSCATPVAQPLQPTRYIVNTVTGLNCVPADTVSIYLSYDRSLYVPTAFSPNADGNNDLFRVKAKGVAIYNLQVYNRWGQLIFEADDLSRGWDGRLKGVPQPPGTYVYVVSYAYFGREAQVLQQKGTFVLIQ